MVPQQFPALWAPSLSARPRTLSWALWLKVAIAQQICWVDQGNPVAICWRRWGGRELHQNRWKNCWRAERQKYPTKKNWFWCNYQIRWKENSGWWMDAISFQFIDNIGSLDVFGSLQHSNCKTVSAHLYTNKKLWLLVLWMTDEWTQASQHHKGASF